jgi:hypothetical protein
VRRVKVHLQIEMIMIYVMRGGLIGLNDGRDGKVRLKVWGRIVKGRTGWIVGLD